MLLLQTEFLAGDLLSSSRDLKIKNILKLQKYLISSLNTLQIRERILKTFRLLLYNVSSSVSMSVLTGLTMMMVVVVVDVLKVLIIIPKEESIINLAHHTILTFSIVEWRSRQGVSRWSQPHIKWLPAQVWSSLPWACWANAARTSNQRTRFRSRFLQNSRQLKVEIS